MIISVHLPKTAGSSFRALLERRFGDRLLLDYDDRPLAHSDEVRNAAAVELSSSDHAGILAEYDCVHGHFLPLKYAGLKNATFITWMRDPVERYVSHYLFWKRNWEEQAIAPRNPGLKSLLEGGGAFPDMEEFLQMPEFLNVYARFLWNFDLGRFSFIGFVETRQASLARLATSLGWADASDVMLNVNPDRARDGYEVAQGLREQIAAANGEDVDLYQWAIARFGGD